MRRFAALLLITVVVLGALPARGAGRAEQVALVSGSLQGSATNVVLINSDGNGFHRLTHGRTWEDTAPAWSADGQRIAFQRGSAKVPPKIWVMRADGSGLRRLTSVSGIQEEPTWSPGGMIAFSLVLPKLTGCQKPEIYRVGADGSGLRRLTRNTVPDVEPSWSSTGKLAFTRYVTERNSDIYVMDGNGAAVRHLTRSSASERDPAWSPDGRKIAFTRQSRNNVAEIWVMNADGSDKTRLTGGHSYDVQPSWSPDGAKIAFSSVHGHRQDVYVMNSDGSSARPITGALPFGHSPAWRPRPGG